MSEREDWPSLDGCFALPRVAEDNDEPWRFTSWWVSFEDGRTMLLFGWAFAWHGEDLPPETWRVAYVKRTMRVRRLDLQARRATVFLLLNALGRGESVASVSLTLGIAVSDASLQTWMEGAKLDLFAPDQRSKRPSAAKQENFAVAPWSLLPSRDSFTDGPASPVGYAPVMRSALVRVDKTQVLPGTDAEARTLLDVLTSDCGLSFSLETDRGGRDLGRLGDLEILVFANAGRPQVSVKTSEAFIEVSVGARLLEAGKSAYVRCRQNHGGATLSESFKLLPVSDDLAQPRVVRFETIEIGPSGADIEVWVEDGQPGELRLVHSHAYAWIRQIGLRMGLMGTQVQFPSKWIDNWVAQRKRTRGTLARADAMRRVANLVHDNESRVGKPDELWCVALSNARKLATHLSPPKSEGEFIRRGIDVGAEDGKVRLAEWFRGMVAGGRSPRLFLIVDPYFNTLGLELIARVGQAGLRFVVVTTLDDRVQDRATKTQELRKQLRAVLPGLNVEIYLVEKERLHDRMIFELESAADVSTATPVRGFHLSNSLQHATDNYPLLITPIPRDLLSDVVDGTVELIADLEPLPDEPVSEAPAPAPRSDDDDETPPPSFEDLESCVHSAVESRDADAFAELLPEFLSMRDARRPGQGIGEDEAWMQSPAFLDLLEGLLCGWRLPTEHLRDTQQAIGLAQLVTKCDFEDWKAPATLWTHGHWWGRGIIWHVAMPLMLRAAPDGLIRIWEAFTTPEAEPEAMSAQIQRGAALEAILAILQREFAVTGPDELAVLVRVSSIGLRSRRLFVRRALASIWGLLMLEKRCPVEQGRSLIETIGLARERVLVVAGWISDLRVEGNRNQQIETPENTELRKAWMAWMVDWWPDALEPKDLRLVVEACEGPLPGGWSSSTTDDLLLPLHEHAKLSADAIADLWLEMLEGRLLQMLDDEHHFYAHTDIRLSEVCAWLFIDQDKDLADESGQRPEPLQRRLQTSLEKLTKVHKRATAASKRPFASSLHPKAWRGAQDVRVWLCAFALMIEHSPGAMDEARSATSSWIFDEGISERAEGDPTRLYWWAAHLIDRRNKPS